jgi:FMN phosphatase YigB (HAD superfamily)
MLQLLPSLFQSLQELNKAQIRRLEQTYHEEEATLTKEWWSKKTHILLDMDGTLVQQPQVWFTSIAFGLLARILSTASDWSLALHSIEKGYLAMKDESSYTTNKEAFVETLAKHLMLTTVKIESLLADFIARELTLICKLIKGDPLSYDFVKLLKSLNKRVILATNPICGQEEIKLRLIKSHLQLEDFDRFTSWENTRGLKPQHQYYAKLLEKENVAPENCVMIGNDLYYDRPPVDLKISSIILRDRLPLESVFQSLSNY